MGSRSFAVKCEVQHQFDRKNSYLVAEFSAKMGVNQSKGSVNITSTPNKGPAPDLNGKKVDEKIITDEKITDDTTKLNGDVEKVTTNGDAKKEEVVEETETKPDTDAEETPVKESDETVEEADGEKTTSEKKKTSTKDKIKKRLSIRSINFLKRKKKEDKEDVNESKNEANETKEEIPEEKDEEKKETDEKEATEEKPSEEAVAAPVEEKK